MKSGSMNKDVKFHNENKTFNVHISSLQMHAPFIIS